MKIPQILTILAIATGCGKAEQPKSITPDINAAEARCSALEDGTPCKTAIGQLQTDVDVLTGQAHDRYADTEAMAAMGAKAPINPLHHDRYTNTEAIAAMGVHTIDTTLAEADVDAFVADNGYLSVESDPTVNNLAKAPLTCANNEIPKWDSGLGEWDCVPDEAGAFMISGTDAYYTDGNVGIGTSTPAGMLHTENIQYDVGTGACPAGYTEGNYDAEADAADCKAIGLVAKANGNVGIGTTNPGQRLEIRGGDLAVSRPDLSNQPSLHITPGQSGGTGAAINVWGNNGTLNDLYLQTFPNGGVGIGTTTPSASCKLDVVGNVCSSGTALTSTREAKRDISVLKAADYRHILDKVASTDVVRFRFKADADDRRSRIGVIAEDAPKDIITPDGKHISMGEYNGFLLAAIKGQQQQISMQQGLLDALRAQNEALIRRMDLLDPRSDNP